MILQLCVVLASSLNVQAATTSLSIPQSIRKGLEFSLEIKKAESKKREADQAYRQARSKVFPTLDLNAAGGTEKRSLANSTNQTGSGVSDTYRARLDLEQPLYQGGVIWAGISAAETKKEAASQNLFAVKQNYIYDIIDAYYRAAEAQILLSHARNNQRILKGYANITRRYASIGRSKRIDYLQAESSYKLSEAQVLASESQMEQNRQDLVRLLGLTESNVQLETEIKTAKYEPLTAEKLYQKAVLQNPEIRAARLEVESLKNENKVKMINHRPKLSVVGSYGYDARDRMDWFKDNSEAYALTLNLKIPLFSGLSSFAESDQYREQLLQKERDLAIKQMDLRKSLAKTVAALDREFQRLKLTQESATTLQTAYETALRDYRNGLISANDVLNIQRTRYDAERQFTSTQFAYNRLILTLRRDLGEDLEKEYTR